MSFDELERLIEQKKAEALKIFGREVEAWQVKIFIHESDWATVTKMIPHNRFVEVLGMMGAPPGPSFCLHPVYLLRDKRPAIVLVDFPVDWLQERH